MRPKRTAHIRALLRGETITFRVLGDDLPLLEGERITMQPVRVNDLRRGDLVLCVVDGAQSLRYVAGVTPHVVRVDATLNCSGAAVPHDYVYGRRV